MTSPARAFAILDLFTGSHPTWHTDEINAALGYARATGYRYVKDLVEAGLLQKVSAGRYALGPRITELDYQLRQSDPVLLTAAPLMDALVENSGLDAVLTAMYGSRLVDIHRASADPELILKYGRGRRRPLFQGAAPKVIIAFLPRAQLVRLYESNAQDIADAGLGASWVEFRTQLSAIRTEGYYRSQGELEAGIGAIAVPVLNGEDEVVAALALVGTTAKLSGSRWEKALMILQAASKKIHNRLARAASGGTQSSTQAAAKPSRARAAR